MTLYERTHGISGFPEDFEANRFDRLPPEQLRAISQKGGIASGLSRRQKAARRDLAFDMLASYDLAANVTEEYRAAVQKAMAQERRKRARRKAK